MDTYNFLIKNIVMFSISAIFSFVAIKKSIIYFQTGEFFINGIGNHVGETLTQPESTIALLVYVFFTLGCLWITYGNIKAYLKSK